MEDVKMSDLSKDHDDVIVKAARWIVAHRNPYCPTTAVKHVPNWRRLLDELRAWGLVQPYKAGKVIHVTTAGWEYLAAEHPEIVERKQRR